MKLSLSNKSKKISLTLLSHAVMMGGVVASLFIILSCVITLFWDGQPKGKQPGAFFITCATAFVLTKPIASFSDWLRLRAFEIPDEEE